MDHEDPGESSYPDGACLKCCIANSIMVIFPLPGRGIEPLIIMASIIIGSSIIIPLATGSIGIIASFGPVGWCWLSGFSYNQNRHLTGGFLQRSTPEEDLESHHK